MGTRSTVFIRNEKDQTILRLFGMWDGDRTGDDIVDYLKNKKVLNCISLDCDKENSFNGVGDLALRLAFHLKGDKIGGWYACDETAEPEACHYEVNVLNNNTIEFIGLIYGDRTQRIFS